MMVYDLSYYCRSVALLLDNPGAVVEMLYRSEQIRCSHTDSYIRTYLSWLLTG